MKGFEGDSDKVKEALGNQDPFEFWIKEANFHCSENGWHEDSCVEALSIVKNTFGETWLGAEFEKSKKDAPPFQNRHPIVGWILTPGKNQVASLLEFAKYIKSLYQLPRFNQVIEMMKSLDQFDTCFNQLSFAFRFLQIGCKDIEFEPPTDSGRNSDIQFFYQETCFIVESFVPRPSGKMWYENILKYSADRAMETAKACSKKITVYLVLKCDEEEWDESIRKRIESSLQKMIQKVDETHLVEDTKEYKLTVHNTTKLDEAKEEEHYNQVCKNALCGINLAFMKKEDTLKVMRGEKVESTNVGRFAIEIYDLGESRTEKLLEKLATKMEKKIVQTRKVSHNAKGIILVGEPYLGNGKKKDGFERIKNKVVEVHEAVVGAMIVKRGFSKVGKPFYSGVLLEKAEKGVEQDLFEKLVSWEWNLYK